MLEKLRLAASSSLVVPFAYNLPLCNLFSRLNLNCQKHTITSNAKTILSVYTVSKPLNFLNVHSYLMYTLHMAVQYEMTITFILFMSYVSIVLTTTVKTQKPNKKLQTCEVGRHQVVVTWKSSKNADVWFRLVFTKRKFKVGCLYHICALIIIHGKNKGIKHSSL